MKPSIIDMQAHMRYVQSQRHTRGDIQRAKSKFNAKVTKRNVIKPPMKGDICASPAIKPQDRTDTVGNTSYFTCYGRTYRMSEPRCRVMKA